MRKNTGGTKNERISGKSRTVFCVAGWVYVPFTCNDDGGYLSGSGISSEDISGGTDCRNGSYVSDDRHRDVCVRVSDGA